MPTTHNDAPQEPEHNVQQWAKVRRRAILEQTTEADWQGASQWQRRVMHEIKLAIRSVTKDLHADTD